MTSRRGQHLTGGFAIASLMMLAGTQAGGAPLSEELQGLLAEHPRIEAGKNSVSASDEAVNKSFSGFLPTINLTSDAGYEHVNSPARRASPGDPYDRGRQVVSVVASQLLYDGGQTSSLHNAAKLQKTGSEYELSATQQTVLFEGISAYLNVLRQQELLRLSRTNEDNIKRQLNLEDERVRRGSGIAVDVLQAKTRLQLAKERRIAVEGALKAAIATYEQVYGHAPETGRMTVPHAPINELPKSVSELVDIAVKEHPSIRSATVQSQVVAEQRDAVDGEYLPRITLEAASNYENNKNTVIGERRDYTVLVKANWNLYNGGGTSASAAKAAYDYAGSQNNAVYVRRKVEEQARVAWETLRTSRERVSLLQNAVNIASEVLDARRKLREAGKETALNVLDAENEVYGAAINLAAATYDARTAAFQTLLAMGRLTPAFASVPLKTGEQADLALPVGN